MCVGERGGREIGGVTLSAGHTVANSIELTTCRLLDMHTRSNFHRKAIFKNLYEDSCNMLITCTKKNVKIELLGILLLYDILTVCVHL